MLPLQQSTALADYVHRRNSVTFSREVPVTVPIPDHIHGYIVERGRERERGSCCNNNRN